MTNTSNHSLSEKEKIDLWDDFQEFRQNKKVEIYYLRAQIENLQRDLGRMDKNQREEITRTEEAVLHLENEIRDIEREIDRERAETRKKTTQMVTAVRVEMVNPPQNSLPRGRLTTSGWRSRSNAASRNRSAVTSGSRSRYSRSRYIKATPGSRSRSNIVSGLKNPYYPAPNLLGKAYVAGASSKNYELMEWKLLSKIKRLEKDRKKRNQELSSSKEKATSENLIILNKKESEEE